MTKSPIERTGGTYERASKTGELKRTSPVMKDAPDASAESQAPKPAAVQTAAASSKKD
ncbi:hypothetical protein [Tianweitania sediminis]|uniref:Uncharacterized protein n=1 Tax=Tianweitania sediminis TaxID=1502156 RepID=A0A8J7R382_9HYPH|nr:hypothetical protein [Tianweitania sediminis]MBP0439435.1 hypothetical protein [Tianweitania sediminis]